jgi:IBR domain, a half RING-finger domain/Zinc finger, C3HC4 type (RING finger)
MIAEQEETKTVERVVFSSTKVTFGAGASVLHVVTGFESCRVLVKNLPANATKAQVISLFTQPGFDKTRFSVIALYKTPSGSHQEAIVMFDNVEDGKNAVVGLGDIEFENEKLKLEMTSNQGQMSASKRDPNVLTVTWSAPSMTIVATYGSIQEAQEKASLLNKRLCCGRRIRVTMNKKPENLPLMYFNPASVVINGLPPNSTTEAIQELCGTSTIKNLNRGLYDLESSIGQLQEFIRSVSGNKEVISFEPQSTPTENGMVSAKIHFASWDQAKHVHDFLDNKPLHFFGKSKCYVSLPDPLHFSLSVPFQQYKAQESMLRSIADAKYPGVRVRLSGGQAGKFARVEVTGSDRRAVGSCKVRVEQLVVGERLKDWDRFFWSKEGELFLASVFDATNAYIRVDKRMNVLKAFGDPQAVNKAKSMIAVQVDKLASSEFVFNLKRTSIRFFVNRGAAILKDQFGEDNVTLDVTSTPCKITIRGGEAARHALLKLVEESLAPTSVMKHSRSIADEEKCPICFDDVENSFRLACGHACCNGCLRHFLTTAYNTKLFPLSCIGNDGTCGRLISIPTIEIFLLPAQANTLLDLSFQDYLDRHPQEFKYCPTPDCPQIYRLEEGKGVVHCPSCFGTCCVSCHGEDHEGFSCEEWKLHRDPEVQERLLMDWVKENANVNKCPSCGALIEKNGGCNHMICSQCKSHICWGCMGVFESGIIYEHLELFHGGAFA